MNLNILVTGGTGYIGSHTVIKLLENNYDVVILDNLSNSQPEVLNRIEAITRRRPKFVFGDVRDANALRNLFKEYPIDAVIHFAGLKAVGESVDQPLMYFDNNISGTIALLQVMAFAGVKKLVFSSSATVYGDPELVPISESSHLNVTNPYGRSKLFVEGILRDLSASDASWNIATLRYFNPVGGHISGLMGEDPTGIPNNLMPFISQVAIGKRKKLQVFGGDYPTPDGTGVRDYIHVEDLALGHLAALSALIKSQGVLTVNLGTGKGYSVLEIIKAFERASGKIIPYEVISRRSGDIANCYADPALAKLTLGWEARFDIDRMCEDTWRWQSMNPNGYRS